MPTYKNTTGPRHNPRDGKIYQLGELITCPAEEAHRDWPEVKPKTGEPPKRKTAPKKAKTKAKKKTKKKSGNKAPATQPGRQPDQFALSEVGKRKPRRPTGA